MAWRTVTMGLQQCSGADRSWVLSGSKHADRAALVLTYGMAPGVHHVFNCFLRRFTLFKSFMQARCHVALSSFTPSGSYLSYLSCHLQKFPQFS